MADEKHGAIALNAPILTAAVTSDTVAIEWSRVEGASGYELELRTPGDVHAIFTASDTRTSFPAAPLASVRCTARVRAVAEGGQGFWSAPLPLEQTNAPTSESSGLLPPPLKTLFSITALKLLAAQLGIMKIQAGGEADSITFAERSRVDPTRLLKLIQSDTARYRLDGPYKLRFSWTLENPETRIAALEKLLRRLGAEDAAAAAA